MYTHIDDVLEFKKMWAEIHIPDETDLPKALEQGIIHIVN